MIIDIVHAINEKDAVFIDVRSQKEFEEDHIPGAINMPILDNEERHIVGYTYKQESKDEAYRIGYEIFNRKISEFEDELKRREGKKVVFYCFRGGMRSGCFVDYFEKKGNPVFKLDGGYKSYRGYVRKEIEGIMLPKKIIVLYGLTGAGKTRLIKKIKNAIDLEGLAAHRSSLFGAVGLSPKSQKMFETNLLHELKKQRDYLILEGESRKIGNIIIPKNLFDAMNKSVKISITCTIETRAERIVEEYFDDEEKIRQIKGIVPRLKERLSARKIEELQKMLEEKDYLEFSKEMLEGYYDPLYTHSVKGFTFKKEISSEDIVKAAKEIEMFCKDDLSSGAVKLSGNCRLA